MNESRRRKTRRIVKEEEEEEDKWCIQWDDFLYFRTRLFSFSLF